MCSIRSNPKLITQLSPLTRLHYHPSKQDIRPCPKLSLRKTELMTISPAQLPRPRLPFLLGLQSSSHRAEWETPGFSLIFFFLQVSLNTRKRTLSWVPSGIHSKFMDPLTHQFTITVWIREGIVKEITVSSNSQALCICPDVSSYTLPWKDTQETDDTDKLGWPGRDGREAVHSLAFTPLTFQICVLLIEKNKIII